MLEPMKDGIRPFCGSGGMFVQSAGLLMPMAAAEIRFLFTGNLPIPGG